MPESAKYRRPLHRIVQAVLQRLDGEFLASSECFFGGGTMLVMALDEYRESRDIDFLSADQEGYRAIYERVGGAGLQALFRSPVEIARPAMMDQYGIRAVLDAGGERLKFEIVREGRIRLSPAAERCDNIVMLSRESAFAEKFMANADRGLDHATLARDVVDLAHMVLAWGMTEAKAGLRVAEASYGKEIQARLEAVISELQDDRAWRTRCERELAVADPKLLRRGLQALQDKRWRKARQP